MEAQTQKAMDAEQKQPKHQQQCFTEKGVMLEPFVHQVGGHCCVLRFGEQTICKPLIPREHQFYKSLPTAMRKFTPQYRGNAQCPSYTFLPADNVVVHLSWLLSALRKGQIGLSVTYLGIECLDC